MNKTTLYKLTDQDGCTRRGKFGETKWSPGFTLETSGEGGLCGPGFVHAYEHPLLAVFFNPIHADICKPLLWEATGIVAQSDHGVKVGCTRLTTVRQIPLPRASTEQRVRFAILCAIEVCKNEEWRRWAENWLSGKDKTASSSKHAAYAPIAYEAAYATEAAYTAAHAAHAAYVVTHAAHAEYAAAYVAAHAAHAAAYAAACAARAAGAAPAPDATHAASEAARAAAKKDSFSLVELAEKSYAMIPKRKSLLGE